MDKPDIQELFFLQIKKGLPSHLSLVNEVSTALNISNDSAYRRIRGEKTLSFLEIQVLSNQFHVSLDDFLHQQSDSFVFSGKLARDEGGFFDEWMTDLHQNMSYLVGFEKKHLYYLTKDVPFISFFQIPELARFKFFLWMKSFLHYDDMRFSKFSIGTPYAQLEEMGRKICHMYNQIPTTEIWNIEGIHTTLHQIEFYRESNLFEDRDEVFIIYDKLEELINHFERQAETGRKFDLGGQPGSDAPEFVMFHNELWLGDNTVLVELNSNKISFLNHSVIHFLITHNHRFNEYSYNSITNLMRKSTQISTVGEKNRSLFFNRLRKKIQQYKKMAKEAG